MLSNLPKRHSGNFLKFGWEEKTMRGPTSSDSVWSLSLCDLQKLRFTFFGISIYLCKVWLDLLFGSYKLVFFCFYPIAFHQTSPKHFYHPNSLLSSQKNPVQPLTVGRRIDVGVTWKYRFWSDLFPLHVDFAAVDLTFWRTKSVKACLFFEGSNRCDGAGGRFIPNKCVKRYLRLLFLFKPFCQFFN